MNNTNNIDKIFGVQIDFLQEVLLANPSAMGYLHGAISEELLKTVLIKEGYEVYRIKEKPAGGFDNKTENYKGDFIAKRPEDDKWLVIESKGLKTNSEFRGDNKFAENNRKFIINKISNIINKNKTDVYEKGYNSYLKAKEQWESKNPGKSFPSFEWSKEFPGPESVNLSSFFKSKNDVIQYFSKIDDSRLVELAFRNKTAAYYIMETHKPSNRTDKHTGIKQAAPLKTDFSILAVDLFQKLGKHVIVFADPNLLSHSPTSPYHLYQNYVIDILIPGLKDQIQINKPWYLDIKELLKNSTPRRVDFDETQIDNRSDEDQSE
jgi:hypothetical protein